MVGVRAGVRHKKEFCYVLMFEKEYGRVVTLNIQQYTTNVLKKLLYQVERYSKDFIAWDYSICYKNHFISIVHLLAQFSAR